MRNNPAHAWLAAMLAAALPALPSLAQVQWTTSVNSQPWVQGMTVAVETCDTLQIVDTFTNNGGATVALDLHQAFVASEVSYLGHSATGGTVSQPAGQVLWAVSLAAGQSASLTVWYHADQCNWPTSTIQRLWVGPGQHRDVTLDKWLHDLWIGSGYDPLVFSGQPASFQITSGNGGGYENNVEVWCGFAPEAAFAGASPPADWVDPTGLNASWTIGDLANGDSASIDITLEVDAGLPPGTPVTSGCTVRDHTGAIAAETTINQVTGTTTLWSTRVDSQPWYPDFTSIHETGDTFELVEELYNRSGASTEAVLSQSFAPSQLSPVDVTVSHGIVTQYPGLNEWAVPIAVGQTVTMTAIYVVEQCTWTQSEIVSTLAESGEARATLILKTPADLWIASFYEPLVVPGHSAFIGLEFGNLGGYENNVTVWCSFPDEAPFGGSEPPPDFVDPGGASARWDVGDLASGAAGGIGLTVDIQEGLPPDTPIELACSIHDHVGDPVAETAIHLLTIDALAIFDDGFESGDTSLWSHTVP